MAVLERYHRQALIQGWKQETWSSLAAIVIGDSHLGQHVADALVGTGIGRVTIAGNALCTGTCRDDGFLTYKASSGEIRAIAVSDLLHQVNPDIHVIGMGWACHGGLIEKLIGESDIVFDTTNDSTTKGWIASYAKRKKKFLVSGATMYEKGCFLPVEDTIPAHTFDVFSGSSQGSFTSLVIAGMMVEEARKKFMPYHDWEKGMLVKPFWYNIQSRTRFSEIDDYILPQQNLPHWRVLTAGAGALGMPAAIALSQEHLCKAGILDYEAPTISNISRQTLHHDALGTPKCESLANKMRLMNPSLHVVAHYAKLAGSPSNSNAATMLPADICAEGYDVILRCFDNFKATLLLQQSGIPLIYGGTSNGTSASVTFFIPGQTSCLDCTVQASSQASVETDRDSCDHVPEPSIITTSKVTAGLMCGELILYTRGLSKDVINGEIAYDVFTPNRANVLRKNELCPCHRG